MPSILISRCSAWPKNAYIYPPMIAIKGGRETWNTKTEVVPANIGGGNDAEVAPGRFSTLFDIDTIITAMKREYSTSGLWVCGSSLSYFSFVLQCLDIIWAAQHDYDAYYVIPIWWISILLDNLMRCDMLLCSWCMSRCILLPHSLLDVLIQHVRESTRGEWCVLDGVTRY
jgi:hypothetical protein